MEVTNEGNQLQDLSSTRLKKQQRRYAEQVYINPSFAATHDPLDPHQPVLKSFKNFNIAIGKDSESRNLIIFDAISLIVDYIQIFALILSMSMRWPWPDTWTKAMSFTYFFNLDFWDFSKRISSPYVAARDNYVSSDTVPFSYKADIVIWYLVLIGIILLAYWIFRILKSFKSSERKLIRLKQVFVLTAQMASFPAGIQICKLFWCLPYPETAVLDVDNSISCWSGGHVVLVLIGITLSFFIFFLFPFMLYKDIYRQIISKEEGKHETYLRLKHFENLSNIDASWVENDFLHFASFNRFWAFFRPLNQLFKFLLLLLYAVFFNSRLWQVSLMFAVFVVLLILFAFRPPYRITSLNALICWNFFCICCMLMIGVMQNIPGIQTVFLVPTYIQVELILINVAWLLGTISCLIYFYLRWKEIVFPQAEFFPFLFKGNFCNIGSDNKRFVFVCVAARELLSRSVQVSSLLCPTHELCYFINLINKLIEDADLQMNPLRSTLRSLLDEMIEAYNRYAPASIFTESNKKQVRTTAATLSLMLPDFTRRLYERDFDLILVSPLKRRLLLKMFVVACFIPPSRRAGASGIERRQQLARNKVWKNSNHRTLLMLDEGFHDEDHDNAKFLEHVGLMANKKSGGDYESTSC